jgi:Arc/MetJ-type ribon-helix-helix transcriptional regulator
MGKTKDRGRYQSISLPVDFIDEVKARVMKDGRYKSVADFAREAMREKLEILDSGETYSPKMLSADIKELKQMLKQWKAYEKFLQSAFPDQKKK